MRVPRVGLSISLRALLFVVAVSAVAMGAARMARLSAAYRARAQYFARIEQADRSGIVEVEQEIVRHDRLVSAIRVRGDAVAPHWERLAAWYGGLRNDWQANVVYASRLREKYDRAAERPWQIIAADPPAPRPADSIRAAAYKKARAEADRELKEGRASIYIYGLLRRSLLAPQLDEETRLPLERIAGCDWNAEIADRADGHNDRIKEYIKKHGLPACTSKR